MAVPLVVGFSNFKKLCKDKRIYYFEGDEFFDFQFLVDGTLIKTTVMKEEIENNSRFFSDYMFAGAMKLQFRIPNPKEDVSVHDIFTKDTNPFVVEDVQAEEMMNVDIQKEGVTE